MGKKDIAEKRRGGSALLIIFLIVVLSLLFFIFIVKKMDIKLVNKTSAMIEKGIAYTEAEDKAEAAPAVDSRMVSAVYVTEDNRISACYIQVINAYEKNIFYIEVPLNTKFSISNDLYRELVTYAPTLPQYVKLSRAYSYFSENYRYEGCTRMLAENIGLSFTNWCSMTEEDFEDFKAKGTVEKDFLSIYKEYADTYRNSLTQKERWAYFEIFEKSEFVDKGTIPGQWDKTDFYITAASAREIIEELRY